MAKASSKQSKDNRVGRKEEREIRETLRQTYATEFPNPKREGCPDKAKLRTLARQETFPPVQQVASHISRCSPCTQELTELARQYKSEQWVYRVTAVALIVIGAAWASWTVMRHRGTHLPQPLTTIKTPLEPTPPPTTQEPSAHDPKLAELRVVVLDLRKRGISRGENNYQGGDLALPKGRLKISIFLPFGSEEGNYEVRISGRQEQVVRAKGRAAMKTRINTLTVVMDTTDFEGETCRLAIRQAGWDWFQYPLRLN